MHRPFAGPSSPLDTFSLELPALAENKLGMSSMRDVAVWWPASHSPEGLPLLICLASYLNTGPSLIAWRGFGETLPERLDRLFAEGTLPPVLVVFVDSYNRLGGTQFVNSPIIGNWVDALADNLVPAIEAKYGCGGGGRRGLFGHSSGGFGALYNLVKRPDVWAAAASHAGDCGFDFVYRSELPKALRVLARFDFNIKAFLDAFWLQEKPQAEQISALMMLAMAASYDPSSNDADYLGIRLPVTLDTCELINEYWENWLSYDPVQFMQSNVTLLKQGHTLYFDCGIHDEYNILYGTRRMHKILAENNVSHRFEEFDGGHGTIGPRYEVSIPHLTKSLL